MSQMIVADARLARRMITFGILVVAALLLAVLVAAGGSGGPGSAGAARIGLAAFPLVVGTIIWHADRGSLLFLTAYSLFGGVLDLGVEGGSMGLLAIVGIPLGLAVLGSLESLQRHPWEAAVTAVCLVLLGIAVVSEAPAAFVPVAPYVAVGVALLAVAAYRGGREDGPRS